MASDEEYASPSRLQFSETLSWRAGKPLTVADLSRRLKTLSAELKDMEQEQVERGSFTKTAHELASQNLLAHRDRGVRALTACCIVDILRVCAPEAPFTASHLRDYFQLVVGSIIPALSDASDPYNTQHTYVLQSLAQVKSILLMMEISNSNELVRQLLSTCFDVLSSSKSEVSKNVEYHMTSMLECIVEEWSSLPQDAIAMILAQFLRADPNLTSGWQKKSSIYTKDGIGADRVALPPSYYLAKAICNSCSERMSRYISQYFSTIILDHSSLGGGLSVEDDDHKAADVAPNDLRELNKAHRLLRELWKAAPEVLQNVIPQIDAELQASSEDLRLLATESIGDLIAGIGAAGPSVPDAVDILTWPSPKQQLSSARLTPESATSSLPFAHSHTSTYRSFLGRRNDKDCTIRAAWTASVGRILSSATCSLALAAEEEMELLGYLAVMLVDSDERVRVAAVRTVGAFPLSDMVHKLAKNGSITQQGSVLYNFAERAKDKRFIVRAEAMPLLGQFWALATTEMAAGDEAVKDVVTCLPSRILEAYYTNDPETQALIDKVLFEYLMPVGFPVIKAKPLPSKSSSEELATSNSHSSDKNTAALEDEANEIRTERLLLLAEGLDAKARAVFVVLLARPTRLAKFLSALLQRWEDYNGGIMDTDAAEIESNLRKLTDVFAKTFPEPSRAYADLLKFAKLHDRRCYSLIRFCISIENDYRKIHKALRELRKRLESSSLSNSSALETVYTLVQRCSHLFFNKSHVGPLLTISRSDNVPKAEAANAILKEISTNAPMILNSHADNICQQLAAQSPSTGNETSLNVLHIIKTCAACARQVPDTIPKDRKFVKSMLDYAASGRPPAVAKHAVTIVLASTDKRDLQTRAIFRQSVENFEYGVSGFVSKLAALSQLMLLAASSLDSDDCDAATAVAISKVLQHRVERDASQEDPDWVDTPDEEIEAKTWALKILVNRLRACENKSTIEDVGKPVYALLNRLISKGGELLSACASSKALCSAMRLQAALMLLKLSTVKDCDALLSHSAFCALAQMAQDAQFPVRRMLLQRTMKYLSADKLSSRFYAIVLLAAFEPNDRLRIECSTWLKSRAAVLSKQRKMTLELSLARFLSVLAHHPDFSTNSDDLEDFVTYMVFYLKSVATEDNVHLIFYIAQRVKSVKDGIDESKSDNLYCLSDLAQAAVRTFSECRDWSMQAYGGKINMPYGVFLPLASHQEAQSIADSAYITEDFKTKIETLVRASMRSKKRKSTDARSGAKSKRPATNSAVTQTSTKTTSRAKDKGDMDFEDKSSPATGECRRSSRSTRNQQNYAEESDRDDQDDERRNAAAIDGVNGETASEAASEDADMIDDTTPTLPTKSATSSRGALVTNHSSGGTRKGVPRAVGKENVMHAPAKGQHILRVLRTTTRSLSQGARAE